MIVLVGRATTRFRRGLRRDEGQTLPLFAVFIPVLIGMLGLTIDVGRVYIAKRHLQTATDAAALAAAHDLPSGTQALIAACTFSATPAGGACPSGTAATTGKNHDSSLGNVSTSAELKCLSVASAGASCVTGPGCTSAMAPNGSASNLGCNAIRVTQTTTINTVVLGFLGIGSRQVTASSTAALGGGRSSPVDVEVIIDSTASMQAFDNCGASAPTSGVTGIPYVANSTPTAEDCAKAGVRALLETLSPCSLSNPQSSISCGTATSNNYSEPEDEVGLMTVPPPVGNPNAPNYVSPGNGLGIPAETNCIDDLSGSSPKYFSTSPSNYASAQSPQYQIVPLSSDYKLNNATTPANDSLLNPDSNLVKAVYWAQCPGGVYPANGGSQASSLSTPGSADYSTAGNNNSGAITGGPNVAGYSTTTTNGGASTISVTRPTPAAANDYVVVSITATGVGSSGALYVCPPSDGTWTTISEKTQGSGATAITQATFGSIRSSSSDPAYAFTFVSGASCSATLPASVEASAIAVRYTGVDIGNPIDAIGSPASGSSGTSGSPLTTPTVQTNHANAQVIRVYSDAGTSITLQNSQQAGESQTSSSQANVTVVTDSSQSTSGSTATATATTNSAQNWVAQTIALEPQQGQSSITINRPLNRAAGDVVVVAVTVQGNTAICAPDSSWVDAGTGAVASGNGAADVTQEAFYSYRSTLDPSGQSYTFSFKNGSCSGTAVTRSASAVAVRYAGANPVAPVETSASRTGSGTALTTATVTTGNVNDAVVSFFGTSATSFSSGVAQSASSTGTASALETYVQTTPGQTTSQSATAASSTPWVALTVAIAADDAGCSGQCAYGLEDPGGASTYYANAIKAAKAALDTVPASRSDAQKVIILLSDGVANTFTSTPCQDAISNAIAAETAGATSAATVYAIAYGSYTDTCTDSQSVITNVPINGACAMRLVADNPYTDTTHPGVAGGSMTNAQAKLCSGPIVSDPAEHFYAQPSGSNLAAVFREIGLALRAPRLVSDDAT